MQREKPYLNCSIYFFTSVPFFKLNTFQLHAFSGIICFLVFQDTVTFADFPLFIRKSSLSFPESPVRHCTPEFFSLFISKKLFTPLFSTVDFTKPSKPVYGEPE